MNSRMSPTQIGLLVLLYTMGVRGLTVSWSKEFGGNLNRYGQVVDNILHLSRDDYFNWAFTLIIANPNIYPFNTNFRGFIPNPDVHAAESKSEAEEWILFERGDEAIISVRGTSNIWDVKHDICEMFYAYEKSGPVYERAQRIFRSCQQRLRERKTRKLTIAGHSLGAAIGAELFSALEGSSLGLDLHGYWVNPARFKNKAGAWRARLLDPRHRFVLNVGCAICAPFTDILTEIQKGTSHPRPNVTFYNYFGKADQVIGFTGFTTHLMAPMACKLLDGKLVSLNFREVQQALIKEDALLGRDKYTTTHPRDLVLLKREQVFGSGESMRAEVSMSKPKANEIFCSEEPALAVFKFLGCLLSVLLLLVMVVVLACKCKRHPVVEQKIQRGSFEVVIET